MGILSWSSADLSAVCQSKCFCNYELEAILLLFQKKQEIAVCTLILTLQGRGEKYRINALVTEGSLYLTGHTNVCKCIYIRADMWSREKSSMKCF